MRFSLKFNLLIVEDDSVLIKQWEEKIKFYHVDDPVYEIIPTYTDNLRDTEKILKNTFFDAVIIDIRLNSAGCGDNRNKDGNTIYKILTETSLSITAVYTAEPEIVIQEDYMRDVSKVFEKGQGNIEEILVWLNEKKGMVKSIRKMKADIDSQMAKVFSKSIWPRWSNWIETGGYDGDYIDTALTRHMSTHLHASFLNDIDGVHPEEHYFIPSLTQELDTGDITLFEGRHYILITPRCEIANKKNDTYQFIELKDISSEFDRQQNIISQSEDSSKINKAKSKKSNLINHGGKKAALHFLPVIKQVSGKDWGPFHAQFDRLITIEKTNTDKLEKFKIGKYASLSNEFVPSLIERLGGYFSRIGTPDYSHPE